MSRPFFLLVSGASLALGAACFGACASGAVLPDATGGGSGGDGGGSGGAAPAGTGGALHGSSSSAGGTTSGGGSTSEGGTTSASGGVGVAQACPPGQLVKSLDASGAVVCAPVDVAAHDAVNAGCAAYFGQSDKCSGCSLPPTKWGSVSGDSCANGAGLDSTCAPANLGGQDALLFGLNPDGDVDGNDKLYLGFKCDPGSAEVTAGPCDAGSFAVGVSGGAVTCARASESVLGYVRESCSLYLGQRDSCDGCTLPPARWGSVGASACDPGAGAGNTCFTASLDGKDVTLLSLGLDGDVDDNDKLYLGMHCLPPKPATSMGHGACEAGQFLSGIGADGSLVCESVAPAVASYISTRCQLTFGFRDACDGCTAPPAKWGRVRDGSCENGEGADNTCGAATLGSETVMLFGLNPDGDVDGNDKLYLGVRCD